jgi:hypothetical protein
MVWQSGLGNKNGTFGHPSDVFIHTNPPLLAIAFGFATCLSTFCRIPCPLSHRSAILTIEPTAANQPSREIRSTVELTNQTIADKPEIIDGNQYNDCTFDRCKIIYRGGPLPSIESCSFSNCTWHFEEGAERTLIFLKMLYHGMGEGGPALVDSAIDQIREPPQ